LVQDGDPIEIDIPGRHIHWDVDEAEIARRRAGWVAPSPKWNRGYGQMFAAHVTGADQGCDFDFLAGRPPGEEPEIF